MSKCQIVVAISQSEKKPQEQMSLLMLDRVLHSEVIAIWSGEGERERRWLLMVDEWGEGRWEEMRQVEAEKNLGR